MKPLGQVRPGTCAVNLHRRKDLFWAATRTLIEVIRRRSGRSRGHAHGTVWSYELEPTAGGTRLVERRHAENGSSTTSNLVLGTVMSAVPDFEQQLVKEMNQSRTCLEGAAEGS